MEKDPVIFELKVKELAENDSESGESLFEVELDS